MTKLDTRLKQLFLKFITGKKRNDILFDELRTYITETTCNTHNKRFLTPFDVSIFNKIVLITNKRQIFKSFAIKDELTFSELKLLQSKNIIGQNR
ncbi:hypothetical protein BpHYR1_041836 [Brachionus plicatilis]|uniref:Uncharacterized protein n=1 Tax=Brachionus plicatilis TaxID=10195 RepID=A0A3M7Q1Y6_BRAPC|nr:hypothetical protein BpHYR1_041836 [Brachionus plicatilis]